MKRCDWSTSEELYIRYHDHEWGVPVFDDRTLFEMLMLEGAQAGLSWITILRRRGHYRIAFEQFDLEKILQYDDAKLESLLQNEGIIRNRLKVYSVRTNATAFRKVQEEFGSFSDYLWGFVNHTPVLGNWNHISEVPATSPLSEKISKDLKKRGFKFVGSTIVYSFLQAVGVLNDHLRDCICHPSHKTTK